MESTISKAAPPPLETYTVTAVDSPEFSHLRWALCQSSIIGLDAEWKPSRNRRDAAGSESPPPSPSPSFPTVTLLQIACRILHHPTSPAAGGGSPVFLVDLISIPLSSVWEMLRDAFVSPDVLKLGFRFKQDLVYLSSTFSSQDCCPGFDRVEPFLDITSIYHFIKDKKAGRKHAKETKSLATICKELLGIHLSKELQCSDWSRRPLSAEQISYAAADAYYLLDIFAILKRKFLEEGKTLSNLTELNTSSEIAGLKEILEESKNCGSVTRIKSWPSCRNICLDECVYEVVKKYGERILLKESDRSPKPSKRKGRHQSPVDPKYKDKFVYNNDDWQGPPPWDISFAGDGWPKFLCDVMVEGLARHLRCVGIDAAIPSSRKPELRQLLDQAYKEKRVLLTRDAKLLKHRYSINQVYRVNNLLKNDQLLEVIKAFGLKISEEQLMSRCTKCNGTFIQKPLTTEEAMEASRGFQIIPKCLFNKNLEFWQCTDCNQLYWEGTQYHNAVQKFVTVCNLND